MHGVFLGLFLEVLLSIPVIQISFYFPLSAQPMKTPLNWITLYTNIEKTLKNTSIKDLAHEYSIHTAEIDGIEEYRIDKVVIGKVLSCTKHPDSTKLSICEVDVGTEKTVILTGAPNIVDATYVPVAVVGAQLAHDFTIGERKMAGMISRGMICGADEIGLARESDGGIMILESMWDATLLESMIGKSVFDLTVDFPGRWGKPQKITLWDTVFEIDNKFITNRADLFWVYGNAREWGAVFDEKFEPYTPEFDASDIEQLPLSIETPHCFAYNAIKMNNITPAASPFGIRLMMERTDLTVKYDLVDITNLISVEFGQPMHVFDADKVVWGITVRMARDGEELLALNGETYTLTHEDMIIADDHWPIALAGIIWGMNSAVSESTQNIIWESAIFDPVCVRLSAQRHAIRTDASTRYEKSLDPLLARNSIGRILDYLRFLGKNIDITGFAEYLDTTQVKNITLDVDHAFINMKAWVNIPQETIEKILTTLGFVFTVQDSRFTISVPSWRSAKDISIKEDIAEEVSRIYGYDSVPLTSLNANFSISEKNPERSLRNKTLQCFEWLGWNEVYNYSFTHHEIDTALWYDDMSGAVWIQNAFNASYTHMRRSLAAWLFSNIHENIKQSNMIHFFEIGKIYTKDRQWTGHMEHLLSSIDKKPFFEYKRLAGSVYGKDIDSLKWDLEFFLRSVLGYVPPLSQKKTQSGNIFHPGMMGQYALSDDTPLLTFGKIHPQVAEYFDIPSDVLYFEADYEAILELSGDKETIFHPISRFQSISRELNFIMPESTETGEIAHVIDSMSPWIHDVVVDSIYRDDAKVGSEKKSVNFAFRLQSDEWTLSDSDALDIQNSIIEKMRELGLEIRGI